MYHYGDPCVHCGVPHDNVSPGLCPGDPSKAMPIAYASCGVRWDGVERFIILWSSGVITERHAHVSERAPYFHFGCSKELIQPPRYDKGLRP